MKWFLLIAMGAYLWISLWGCWFTASKDVKQTMLTQRIMVEAEDELVVDSSH